MLKSFLKLFHTVPEDPALVEGAWADQYHAVTQDHIRAEYLKRWAPKSKQVTPLTDPHLFDPCEPPSGWRYDPYYELWLEVTP